ncbi:MAG: flagellar biosynthesis protein FlgJ [Alteromonadaceae bacterium]|nr:MAG: flagellar biosynthesis protein FlgJ [Alteromonadaceae bacterium]
MKEIDSEVSQVKAPSGKAPLNRMPSGDKTPFKITYSKVTILMAGIVTTALLIFIAKSHQPSPDLPLASEEPPMLSEQIGTQDSQSYLSSDDIALPDFAAITDVKLKKQAFFDYLRPIVAQANNEVLLSRVQVLTLSQKSELSQDEAGYLLTLAKRYRVKGLPEISDTFYQALLTRVDKVPVALALAQAANESAWGTSRFALEANNLFGQWCFTKGCGVVPRSRDEGKVHEVARFESVPNAVKAYMKNINSGSAYQLLRELRSEMRKNSEQITASVLAQGLSKYSWRGDEYIKEIRAIIRVNKLEQYDVVAN